MTVSVLGMPGQLANESIVEYRQRFPAQLALIEAEEQCQAAAEAARLQAEAAAAAEKQRLQAKADADAQVRRKEAQDLLQRHEAANIEKLKFWHFEPSENHEDATPEEQHKEFLAKLVTRLVCTCNHLQFELANLRRAVRNHKDLHEDATWALDSRVQDLEQVAPGPDAGESSSAPSTRQLEERVYHVVAMLGDISTFAAPATISKQLDTLKTEVLQLHQLPNKDGNTIAQHYKMSTFHIEKLMIICIKTRSSSGKALRWNFGFCLSPSTLPAPLMDVGVEVVDLHDYVAKIDHEFKTQQYDDIDAPLLYIHIEIGEATCSALIDCGAKTLCPVHGASTSSFDQLSRGICRKHSITRDDIEEIGVCFLHALPPQDISSTDASTDPRITELLNAYGDVFEAPRGVVSDRPIRHEIILEAGAVPPRGCIYRMSEEKLSVLQAQLDDLFEKGWIRPSSSPYGLAPRHTALSFSLSGRSRNSTTFSRLCIDYRKLNAQAVKNADPLPRIDDLLECLGGAKFFSKLELKSGYHQLDIRQEDRYKTTFKTRYSWLCLLALRMPPATFQAAMRTEFRHMMDRFVRIYLDDILVYNRSLDEHVEHLRTILERLRKAKYKANRDKCEFAWQELEYHDVPEDIVSDRDTRFMSAFWTSLMQESGTKMKPRSARHPQTNGQTERAHQTAQMMLRTLICADQKDWFDRLHNIEFAYNTSLHPAIGVTPFVLHHSGRKGRIFADLFLPRTADINVACSPASVRKYRELLAQARANLQKAQVRVQHQASRRRVPCPIRTGDLVWVSAEEFALDQDVSHKLLPKWFGPWLVTSAAGDEPDGPSFVINIPAHLTVHPVFHTSKLTTYTPAKSDDFSGRQSQDPSSMDGHQEVDRVITDRKYDSKCRQYKVTFKACDPDDNQWISRLNHIRISKSIQKNPVQVGHVENLQLRSIQAIDFRLIPGGQRLVNDAAISDYKQACQFRGISEVKENVLVTVSRGGSREVISIWELVVGDVVHLRSGDQEPVGLPHRPTKHHIELLPGAVPPKGHIYKMSPAELRELRNQLETLTSKGWIRPSTSEFGAPVFFVPKGNGEFRMCRDCRGLNKITRKSTKPLPRIDDLLDMVHGCTLFSKVDLKSGYHQIAMAEEDVHKTTFKTRVDRDEVHEAADDVHDEKFGMPSRKSRNVDELKCQNWSGWSIEKSRTWEDKSDSIVVSSRTTTSVLWTLRSIRLLLKELLKLTLEFGGLGDRESVGCLVVNTIVWHKLDGVLDVAHRWDAGVKRWENVVVLSNEVTNCGLQVRSGPLATPAPAPGLRRVNSYLRSPGRGERSLEVTAVIFVAPEAWAKIVVPLVLGQGGGLEELLQGAREVRREWIGRVRERLQFVALEMVRFAGRGELPGACYPLTLKVKPAAVSRDRTGEATISEEEIVDIIRKRKETEGQIITVDRLAKMDIGDGNLTREEREFVAMTLRGCDKAIAFDDSERGRIDPRYAKPARIHTIPHVPWKDRPQWKYAQKEEEGIVAFTKEKIRTFVAEPCESAYSNKWFFLRKGGSNKLRWIQNLQRTNAVTIRDVGSIPEVDLLAEGSAGRSIYSICDLFSGYDEIPLDYRDRHMTAMHTPLGLVQIMVVPMGWTNGVAVFQRAMIAVLKEFIPEKVEVFLDDFPIKGPVERDETEVFPGVRKFMVDHMSDVRDVLVKLDDANLTVSGTKSRWGVSSIKILGFICDKDGRRPDPEKLAKLMTWPLPLKSITKMRGRLGPDPSLGPIESAFVTAEGSCGTVYDLVRSTPSPSQRNDRVLVFVRSGLPRAIAALFAKLYGRVSTPPSDSSQDGTRSELRSSKAVSQLSSPASNGKGTTRRDKALREVLLRDLGGRCASMTRAAACPGEGGEGELEALGHRESKALQVVVDGLAEVKVIAMVTLRRQRGNSVLLTILERVEATREVAALLRGTAGATAERGTALGSVVRGGGVTSTLRLGGGSVLKTGPHSLMGPGGHCHVSSATSAVPCQQQCHISSTTSATVPRATVPCQQCPATMTGSALGMPGQLANESIAEYRQRFEAQLALIEAEEQRQLAAEAVRLQAEAAATVEKQRLQAEAEADTQARRKEAQDLLQRH
ncbi:hypothetical protein CBR_g23220 [Chara braunii]|uniref:Integrase catalytic domain-containing protein n=1 Tax=Chara braunii TaxID=69332 RepID=A0A388JV94_CHABU|nr:hypothetical protein CBR_g23220 [Chara braunii]|eukprot:GBG61705.1 hypothetical protein CBR_g23220 [Chara braunii]